MSSNPATDVEFEIWEGDGLGSEQSIMSSSNNIELEIHQQISNEIRKQQIEQERLSQKSDLSYDASQLINNKPDMMVHITTEKKKKIKRKNCIFV